jgi:hypothetical protein
MAAGLPLLSKIVVEVPVNAILIVQTKYANTNIENAVRYVRADITNGSLTMDAANNADIRGRQSDVRTDDINTAIFNLSNSKLIAGRINNLSIVSSLSILQLNQATTMKMHSVSDVYRIDQAGDISGKKDFGRFTIETLVKGMDLSGASADLKINAFGRSIPIIKISSKYADLRLPVYQLKNYSIVYDGSSKDVHKISSAQNITANISIEPAIINHIPAKTDSSNMISKTKFEAIGGDITGSHAKINIDCPFCNVVFN